MSVSETVTVTTRVAADPATAFKAFTEEVDAWWRRGPRFRIDPTRTGVMRFESRVGGRLLEVYDEKADELHEIGRVLEWEPGRRLRFEFRARAFEAGERTEVEVRFEAEGDGTRVTLHHRGWEAFPADHPVRHGYTGEAFISLMGLWWSDLLVTFRQTAAPDRGRAS